MRQRFVQWLAARSVRQLLLATGAVALLVSGAFGGLRQAQADELQTLVAGRPHVAEPIRLTVKSVRWTEDLGEAIGPSEVGRYLVVLADVSSDQQDSVPASVVSESLRLSGLRDVAQAPFSTEVGPSEDAVPRVLVTADRVRLSELGPGLTYEVAFVWEQRTSEPVPTTVGLLARAHGFRADSIDGQLGWRDVVDDATGRFPVTELEAS